ncbi:glycosyltransferase family 2 protein [Obesumbacterium proteus]|uniref:Putative glycosyltransferase EpsE n=1 Tax=Hafnia alvei TaxID=569 RepID=A0A172X0C1_HAFAL|nr:glycosyltransferase family 2 protein [Obesumbacterium proteus]ANF30070.1 putative glycosyltransferase EpsE [Hafnia alvei]MCE9916959.1 glycosyltransferase family 2 protein [Obesumbacterium proteus]
MIDVVMATYNGEMYLEEQIKSIQNCNSYNSEIDNLIICDDGSSDSTITIINRLAALDDKIKLIENPSGIPFRVIKNFIRGIKVSNADYILFSDQDDYWNPDKIILMKNKMLEMESKHSADTPLLVFSDLEVVNECRNEINKSFFDLQNINSHSGLTFERLLLQNIAPGCSMMANRALLDVSFKYADENIIMHDWWMILFASYLGKVEIINEPLIQYRQHGNNQVGASKSSGSLLHAIKSNIYAPYTTVKRMKETVSKLSAQANSLRSSLHNQNVIKENDFKSLVLDAICDINNKSTKKALVLFFKNGVRRHGAKRNIGYVFGLLLKGIVREK